MSPSTPAHKIPRWRSTLRQAILIAINDDVIDSIQQVENIVTQAKKEGTKTLTFIFQPKENVNFKKDTGIPQIHFDQMNVIGRQHHAARSHSEPWMNPTTLPPVTDDMILSAIAYGNSNQKLT